MSAPCKSGCMRKLDHLQVTYKLAQAAYAGATLSNNNTFQLVFPNHSRMAAAMLAWQLAGWCR